MCIRDRQRGHHLSVCRNVSGRGNISSNLATVVGLIEQFKKEAPEMWNRRKDEQPPAPRPAAAQPPVAQPARPQPAKEGIPMSTVPSRPTETFDAPRTGNAVLGKSAVSYTHLT